jgi:hypothetical protein
LFAHEEEEEEEDDDNNNNNSILTFKWQHLIPTGWVCVPTLSKLAF